MATNEYRLELDYPYDELSEMGYRQSRLLRDINPGKSIDIGSGCWFERHTGTLMLKPVNWDPDAWYSPSSDGLRLGLDDLDHAEGKWQEHPSLIMAPAPAGNHPVVRSGLTLTELCALLAIAALENADIYTSKTLVPVLASKTSYPINQAFHVVFESYGAMGVHTYNWAGIRFGDFLLVFHTNGKADLYWSSDGSCAQDKWVWKKTFSSIATNPQSKGFGGLTQAGIGPASVTNVSIIPFGRKHIWLQIQNHGVEFGGIYTHEESVWNEVDQRYEITKAGKIGVLLNPSQKMNIGVKIAKMGYKTSGTFRDAIFQVPYAPTVQPEPVSPVWVKTMGSPTVTGTLLDANDAPFVSDGVKRSYRVKLDLAGDGTCTPWVDCYHLAFPEVVRHYANDPIVIDGDRLVSMEIEDGESFADQRGTFVINDHDDGTDLGKKIHMLLARGEVHGRLTIAPEGGQPTSYAEYLFTRPRGEYIKRGFNRMTLSGKNLGVARLEKKRFLWPQMFDGEKHPDVVKTILKLCGWPSAQIDVEDEDIRLTSTRLMGEGNDSGETEFKWQPAFNSHAAEFIDQVRSTYSNWPLYFDGCGVWRYKSAPEPTSPVITFYAREYKGVSTRSLWPYYDSLTSEMEPPEGNMVYVIGKTDSGQYIGNYAIDWDSIYHPADPKPMNYIGRIEPIVYIDMSMNSGTTLDYCLRKLFDKASKGWLWFTWKGPFVSTLKINDGVALEGVGLIWLKHIATEAKAPAELERAKSTTYSGVWIKDL
jgi:hypothetical protein